MKLIRQEFLSHSVAGTCLPSIRKLAEHYGVSAPTVRTALLALQQEGWVELWHGRHTFATGGAARRRVGLFTEADITPPPHLGLRVASAPCTQTVLHRAGLRDGGL